MLGHPPPACSASPCEGPPPPERRPRALVHPLLRHLVPLLVAAALAAVVPVPAPAATYTAPPHYRPKDFTIIKKDGVYHLFYIRHSDLLPPWATEVDFGHASSPDLYRWTNHPPVLPIQPYGWDNAHVWAPHVIEADGLYWMFYTGVSEVPGSYVDTQRMGVAVSTDLMTWNRISSGPIWSNDMSDWAWWAPTNPNVACRDPFVMRDPAAPGQWLMYYTASPASDPAVTVVGVARCPNGHLVEWVDEKPLWITHHSLTFNTLAESPHLFEHDGRWFMFMTTSAGQPLTFYTSDDPLGDPAAWTYRGRLRNMLNFDTSGWGASEAFRDGATDYFAFVDDNRVEVQRIVWGQGDNFTFAQPSVFHMNAMSWSSAATLENRLVGLRLSGSNAYAFTGELEAFTRNAAGQEIPVPMDSLGLPPRPVLAADTVVIPWYTRRWPSSRPLAEAMPLRVAMKDGSESTPWLLIHSNPVQSPVINGPGGSLPDSAEVGLPLAEPDEPPVPEDPLADLGGTPPHAASPGAGASPRVLRDSPLGTSPAVAFEMERAGSVRAEVFDIQGRRVALLAERAFGPGAHVLSWDGRDASGLRAARGLYFVRLQLPARTWGLRLLLDR